MNTNTIYFKQARLLLQVMPFVAKEACFGLKGGTAINFFLRDMPRLSVDIDLAYLPVEPRDESLKRIDEALARIGAAIRRANKSSKVQEGRTSGKRISNLFVNNGEVQIKIEPHEVIRGCVFPFEEMNVSSAVEDAFEMSATMRLLSVADIYGGKLCAALDRQHPRDIFDIKLLLDNEGITPEIRKAFVVYLAGHDRPIHELLDPALKDLRGVFDREFAGMTTTPFSYEDLVRARVQLIKVLRSGLTGAERRFLISLKERAPNWSLLGLDGIDKLPSIQWKIANLAKMNPEKHAAHLKKLRAVLE